nr:MAG TPA: hypothetical protein [Caudoviricetes sp.]
MFSGWTYSNLLTMYNFYNSHIRELFNLTSIFIMQALPC